jgi:hypothetical protein
MEETPEIRLRRQLADCEALIEKLEGRLPNPALEWPITVLRYAMERNRQSLMMLN